MNYNDYIVGRIMYERARDYQAEASKQCQIRSTKNHWRTQIAISLIHWARRIEPNVRWEQRSIPRH